MKEGKYKYTNSKPQPTKPKSKILPPPMKEAMQDIPVSLTPEQVSQLKEYGYHMIKATGNNYLVRVTNPYQFWGKLSQFK